MDELRKKYTRLSAEYDAAVQQALLTRDQRLLARVRTLNTEVSKLLDQMIQALTFAKKDTPILVRERDILVEKLRRIQRDYNGLLVNTDALETLRRIREQESGEGRRQLIRYLAFFFIVCAGVLLMLIFVRKGQKNESAATSAPMPSITPPLT